MNLVSNLLIFLLLMEGMAQNGGQPPSIPFLSVLPAHSEHPHQVFTNASMQFSVATHTDISEISCDTAAATLSSELVSENDDDNDDPVTFTWKVNGEPVTDLDNENVLDANGTLVFLNPVLGTVECLASNQNGVSFSGLTILREEAIPPEFKFMFGPEHLHVPLNSTVKFNCESSSEDTSLEWTFNAEPLPSDNFEVIKDSSSNKQTLVIERVDIDSVGNIGCFIADDVQRLYQEGSVSIVEGPGEERMVAPKVKLEENPTVITLLAGDTMQLDCQTEGTPDPKVVWLHDGVAMMEGDVVNIEGVGQEHAGKYTCVASNLAGSDYQTIQVEVFDRTEVSGNGDSYHYQLQLGQNLSLACRFHVDFNLISSSAATISWFLDNKQLQTADDNLIVSDEITSTEGEFKLRMTMTDSNFGNYTCLVKTRLQETAISYLVERVSAARILNEMTERLVLQGTVLKLDCDVVGEPPPLVEWMRDGERVEDVLNDVVVHGHSLEIGSVKAEHSGAFTCHASNLVDSDVKNFNLSVAEPTRPPQGYESESLVKLAGESLTLPCQGQVDPLLLESAQFTWLKDGEILSTPDTTLTLQRLKADHEGVFTCRIRTILDELEMETSLKVVTAAPVIHRGQGTVREMTGGNISIVCEASGIPAPTNTFRFGDNDYTGTVVSRHQNRTVSSLELLAVTSRDEGEYICLAVNDVGIAQARTTLDVFNRTQIVSGPRNVQQWSGESLSLPCQIVTDDMLKDSLVITWMKDQQRLERPTTSTSLILSNLTREDEGIYTCIGETSKDSVSASGRVTVLFEAPAFSSTPRDIRVLEGRNTQLVCTATGIPRPRIDWTFEGVPMNSNEGILRLTKLSLDKEGRYECTAVNIYGSVSQSVKLQVIKEARKENENLIPDVVKNIKDNITIPCDFKLDQRIEPETRVIWYKDNQEISFRSSKYSMAGNRSLKIWNIEMSDQGQYECKIITPLQRVQSRISLIVNGETPEIVSNFNKTTFHEGETLQLSCRARGVPVPVIEWIVRDQPVDNRFVVKIPVAGSSEFVESRIVIQRASRDHDGLYQCVARNSAGTVVKSANVGVLRRTRVTIQGEEKLPEISVLAGQKKLKLPCKMDLDPNNRITGMEWKKNGTKIGYGGDDIIDFGVDGAITIYNVQLRHEGIYTCKVTTMYDEESAEIKVKVQVNAPVITQSSSDAYIFSGESTKLECTADGIPEPEIRWTFNRTITKVTGPQFDIKSAISADGGFYTCTASNTIGETEKTIRVTVVSMPPSTDIYQAKKETLVELPCVLATEHIDVVWLRNGAVLDKAMMDEIEGSLEVDRESGYLVVRNMSQGAEGVYTCRVGVGGNWVERKMEVKLMNDILTMDNTRLTVKEGENFTLKCDVLPDVNAKRMWNKDGQLVFPESGSGLDILEQGGVLTVAEARTEHSGEWKCIASTAWGHDTIIYSLSVLSRTRIRLPCADDKAAPVISQVVGETNSSVGISWTVENFNSSCFQEFVLFWWSDRPNSDFNNQTVELTRTDTVVDGLVPGVTYYFQVNLVRDRHERDYVDGQTKSHVMQFVEVGEGGDPDAASAAHSFPKAVIFVVIAVAVVVLCAALVVYLQRDRLSRILSEKKGRELPEMSSKLVMNPDFMASLAPQWPEPEPAQWPEPEPAPEETHSFLPQPPRAVSRRNSKDSLSSWSSLFNVATTNPSDTDSVPRHTEHHLGGDGGAGGHRQHHRHHHNNKPLDRRRQNY